jgi:hypothetical protein
LDTSHTLVAPTTTREVLYVSATRGRHANHLYVDVAYDPDPATGHDQTQPARDAHQVLAAVLANEGADVSAHETIRRAQQAAESWATLHAEYQTIAAAAQADRWSELVNRSGLSPAQQELVRLSPARGALQAALREAESCGLDVEGVLPLLARGGLDDANDPSAALHSRVQRWTAATQARDGTNRGLIAGLVPRARGARDPDLDRALAERERAMERRAQELARQALSSGQTWARQFGSPPNDPAGRSAWLAAVATVAAYREQWSVGTDSRPLGSDKLQSLEQLTQRRRAQTAVDTALALVRQERSWPSPASSFRPGLTREHVRHGPEV